MFLYNSIIKNKWVCTAKKAISKMKRMGENICKWRNRQGINFQNIQIAHWTYQQKKPTQSKNGQKTYTDISTETYRWHRKRCSSFLIIRDADQSYNEVPHNNSPGHQLKSSYNKGWRWCTEREPSSLLMGM